MTAPQQRVRTAAQFRWVPLSNVRTDIRVQRELRQGWVNKRIPDFDPDGLGAIVLSHRADGHFYVLDGQHRVELIRAVGWADQSVFAEVYERLSLEEEAAIFLERNEKITVATMDKFRVRITRKDPEAVAINQIVKAVGLKIASNGQGSVAAVASLERVYRGAGIGESGQTVALRDTLRVLMEAWGGDRSTFDGKLIEGVGMMLIRYNTHVNRPNLVGKLSKFPGGAPGVVGQSRARHIAGGGRMASAVAEVLVDVYNRGKRGTALEPWKQAAA